MDFHGTWEVGAYMRPQLKWDQSSSRDHVRSVTPKSQDMHNWSVYPHTLIDFHGTWTKEYWGRTHMWPQQLLGWNDRSCFSAGTYFMHRVVPSLPCFFLTCIYLAQSNRLLAGYWQVTLMHNTCVYAWWPTSWTCQDSCKWVLPESLSWVTECSWFKSPVLTLVSCSFPPYKPNPYSPEGSYG